MKGGSFTELATAANYAEILGLLTILEWSTWLAEHISEYGEVNDNNVQAAHIEYENWKPRKK